MNEEQRIEPADGARRRGRFVYGWILFLAVVGLIVFVGAVLRAPAVQGRFHVSLIVLVLGAFLVESFPIHYEFRSSSHTLTLPEIFVVMGLYGATPAPAACALTIGVLASRILVRKSRGQKLAFNAVLSFLESAVPFALFAILRNGATASEPRSWIAVAVSLVALNIVSEIAVVVVMLLHGERLTLADSLTSLTFSGASLGSASIGILAVIGLEVSGAVWPILLLAASLFGLGAFGFTRIRQRYEKLQLLHGFVTGIRGSTEVVDFFDGLLHELRERLRTDGAQITVLKDGVAVLWRSSGVANDARLPSPDDWVWTRVIEEQQGLKLVMNDPDDGNRRYLTRSGVKDLLVVPLVNSAGVLAVLSVYGRSNDTSTFSNDDLEILSTMVAHITVALENEQLIERLGHEITTREYQALHDGLTGMPNRVYLARRIGEQLERLEETGTQFAVGILDLNRFKEINDTLGHDVGDEVLIMTAKRLQGRLPSGTELARLGGDEFAVLFTELRDDDDLKARAKVVLNTFATPFQLADAQVPIDIALGISVAPKDGLDQRTLMKRADVAMYAAKRERKSSVAIYKPEQERSSERQLGLVSDLRVAISNNSLVVHYQPKANLCTGEVNSVEALVRWNHSTLGWIGPDEFIPLAEHTGLIGPLTSCVLSRAIEQCAMWEGQGQSLVVAVNISCCSLQDPGFVGEVAELLWRHNLSADRLMFEVTERELVADNELTLVTMRELHDLGVRFSIDDFGTGYSSLAYLTRLPVDEVKIDRSFVTNVATSSTDQAIVRAIVQIADSFGLTTVAEGLEDTESWTTLTALGCTSAQGYLLSRALDTNDLLRWVASHSPLPVEQFTTNPALAQ
jgi:diguanylate cyclase (GGDEF)-like protein